MHSQPIFNWFSSTLDILSRFVLVFQFVSWMLFDSSSPKNLVKYYVVGL